MRKSHLNLDQANIDDKQAFEMNESADLIRLYSQLLEVRERQIKKEEQYNVKIINQTNSEIQKTFKSPNKNNVNEESRTPSNKIDKNSMFTVQGQIGRGSFGEVFLVQLNSNKQQYALKLLKKSQLIETQMMKYAYTERNILSQADCPFLAKLHFAFQTNDKLFLVMDNGEYGDLSQHLQVAQKFDEERAKFYCAQILIALEYLHNKNVIYRDLKSDNVVVSKDGYLLLTDFGLAKENVTDFNYGATSFCGSLAYMSPEMFKQNAQHGKSTDIYQFGVLLYELLTGNPPFFLLIKDPRFRPTYGQVKEHPFFKEIDWEKIQKKQLIPPKPIITKQRYKRIQQDIFKDGLLEDNNLNKDTNFLNFKFQKDIENIRNIDSWTFVNSNCDDNLNSYQNNKVLSMKN
ncbi:Protein kinase-like domain [Pseudocohnilembus persalinus]|uniref:Protein kinase-like domain n=1 Tax=Pseudocohnilembus persalinus TaxID=266149 RepID=A0A0V0QR38_PSEPJ|nr:Protein kinase-like domain [Pseudocohnilembus persalinus]|eukprot:KRX04472.1 Protein kinase-like domain [Pseudocohnilembus persalinus]